MTLPIIEQYSSDARPIVNSAEYDDIRLFFDTGAGVPVWVSNRYYLMKHLPRVVKTNYIFWLSGFGGSGSTVPVYKFPEFIIRDSDNNFVKFLNLHVAFARRDDQFDMVLSYNMFEHMQLIFDQRGSKQVCINNPKQIYVATPTFRNLKGCTFLTGQAVLAQDGFADKTTCFT